MTVLLDDALDRDDGVGSVGHGAARRNRSSRAGRERLGRREPGGHANRDRQLPGRVPRAYGEAVHRRAREWRQVRSGERRLGQHPARRSLERNRLGRKCLCSSQYSCERFVDREQLAAPRRTARHGFLGLVVGGFEGFSSAGSSSSVSSTSYSGV